MGILLLFKGMLGQLRIRIIFRSLFGLEIFTIILVLTVGNSAVNASEGLSLCNTPMYSPGKSHNDEYAEMTINEIMNGSEVSSLVRVVPCSGCWISLTCVVGAWLHRPHSPRQGLLGQGQLGLGDTMRLEPLHEADLATCIR